MKHEVEFKQRKSLRIEDLKTDDYIGFIANGNKWFIFYADRRLMAISFCRKGHYAKMATPNEIYTTGDCTTIKDCIGMQYGVSKVLKFDTPQELHQWLASDEN